MIRNILRCYLQGATTVRITTLSIITSILAGKGETYQSAAPLQDSILLVS